MLSDARPTQVAAQCPLLHLGLLTDDCVEAVLDQLPPSRLLLLKAVSKAWRSRIRIILCSARWARCHGLPAAWAAAARELARSHWFAPVNFVKTMLPQAHLALEEEAMDPRRACNTTLLTVAILVFSGVLTSLSVSYNDYSGAAGAAAISEALKVNKMLLSLKIKFNDISNAGAVAIGKALRVNGVLTALTLQHNNIRTAGAVALSKALKVNAVLVSFALESNHIHDEGAAAIAEALKVNATLKALSLCDTNIFDAGAAALGEALKVNGVLTQLNLSANKIGNEGAAALGEALKVTAALKALSLKENHMISDEGQASIDEALAVAGRDLTVTRP